MWAQNRYPGDDAKAEALANAMPYIWKTLNDLMGPEPVSDAGLANNGGDGALDIYLLHAPTKIVTPNPNTPNLLWNGYAASSDPADGCHAARYLVVDSNLPLRNPGFNGILDVAAHELMHAIQFAYKPCADQWLQESTATWAENFVYPQTNSEHSFGAGYLALLIRSIYTFDYGAYLFSYFHESAGKSADFMPLLWEVHKTKPALEAFHDVLPEGWDKAWPEFLAQTWNRPPVNTPDGYMMKDKLTAAPPLFLVKDVSVSTGIQDYPIELPKDFDPTLSPPAEVPGLAYLAGAYYHYKFKNNVRAVAFENSIADEAILHASVWGIEKIEGQWQDPVDYTKDFRKFWCRDQVDQDLEELVLIFGNSDWEKRKRLNPKKPSKVVAYAAGCTAWEGTVSFKMTMVTAQLGRLVETVTASMRLELDSAAIVPGQRHEYWEAVSGSIQWTDEPDRRTMQRLRCRLVPAHAHAVWRGRRGAASCLAGPQRARVPSGHRPVAGQVRACARVSMPRPTTDDLAPPPVREHGLVFPGRQDSVPGAGRNELPRSAHDAPNPGAHERVQVELSDGALSDSLVP